MLTVDFLKQLGVGESALIRKALEEQRKKAQGGSPAPADISACAGSAHAPKPVK